jgi:hypothetical protein
VSMNLLQWLEERKFILQRLARCYEADDRWCIAWEMCVREEKMQWLLQFRKRMVDYGWQLGFRKWERKKSFFFFLYTYKLGTLAKGKVLFLFFYGIFFCQRGQCPLFFFFSYL